LMLGLETASGPKLVGLALGIVGAGLIVLLDPGVWHPAGVMLLFSLIPFQPVC